MTTPRHVVLGGMAFRLDETQAEVTMRRISDSLMAPRQDISGVPGAINLQRDVWLWTMSDFIGGEGRVVFDSGDPLGPPTFWKTEGGIDVRKKGQFSLHPDEDLVTNKTGGGSVPSTTSWTGTSLQTESGNPEYNFGPDGDAVLLHAGDEVRTPVRTPGAATMRVYCRFTNANPKRGKKVQVRFRVRDVTNGQDTVVKTVDDIREGEGATLTCEFMAVAGRNYRYQAANIDDSANIRVKSISEEKYGTGPASSIDIRDLRLGIGEDVYGLAWDGSYTDVLVWNFSTNQWDQAVANMVGSQPRAMSGSDQFMYSLHANGEVWKWNSNSAAKYANSPNAVATGFETQNFGEPLGIIVSNNKVFTLFQQGLFQLTADFTGTLPLISGDDYKVVALPGEFAKELSPNTKYRQRMAAISNGVRFFINVSGEQAVIYEYSGYPGALTPTHQLPSGYVITAIKHYANITFIAATFTNRAALPAEKRAGLFYISADNLMYFLGYLRFEDSNSQPVASISSYGHDVYFLQGRRIWRYNTGSGGITVENETSVVEQSSPRAMARMDKKFWVACEGEGTFVSQDSYPRIPMYLYSPVWDYDVPDIDKVLFSFDVEMVPLPANTVVEMAYSLDETDVWTELSPLSTAGTTKHRWTISTSATTVKFRTLQWRLGLASIDGVSTPTIRSVTARAYVLEYEDSFELTLLLDDDDAMNRLQGQQLSARAKSKALWQMKQDKVVTSFVDHYSSHLPGDADTYTVIIEDPFQEMVREGQSSLRLRLKVVS